MKKILFLCLSTTTLLNQVYSLGFNNDDFDITEVEDAGTPLYSLNSVSIGNTEPQGYGYSSPLEYHPAEPQLYGGYFAGVPYEGQYNEPQGYGYSPSLEYLQPEPQGFGGYFAGTPYESQHNEPQRFGYFAGTPYESQHNEPQRFGYFAGTPYEEPFIESQHITYGSINTTSNSVTLHRSDYTQAYILPSSYQSSHLTDEVPALKILHALKYAGRKTDYISQSIPYTLHDIVTGEVIDIQKMDAYKEYIIVEYLAPYLYSRICEYARKMRINPEQTSTDIEAIYLEDLPQYPYKRTSNVSISDLKRIIKSVHFDQIKWGENDCASINLKKVIPVHEHLIEQFKKGDIIDGAAYSLLDLLEDQITLHPSIEELLQIKERNYFSSLFHTSNTLSYLIHPRFAIIDDSTLQNFQVLRNLAPLVLGEHEDTDEKLLPEPIKEKFQKITQKYNQVLLNAFHDQKIQLLYINEISPQPLYNSECQNLVYEAIEELIAHNDPSLYDYYISFLWGANYVHIGSLNETVFFELPNYMNDSNSSINPQDFIHLFEEHLQDVGYPTPYVLTPSSKDIQKLSKLTEDQQKLLKLIDKSLTGLYFSEHISYYADGFVSYAETYESSQIILNGTVKLIPSETEKMIFTNPVLIKAKKFIFSNNIIAHGGYIAVAEEFEFKGGQITHPYLCHFIQVPKGTIILDNSFNISTAAVD